MQRLVVVVCVLVGIGSANAQLLSGVTNTVGNTLNGVGTTIGNLFGGSTTKSTPTTSTSSTPTTTSTTKTGSGSAAADPQVVDFSGRHFEFMGEVGGVYNVIQDSTHQVSMRLKLGVLSDHNGTYIDGIGFAYQGHKVVIELINGDEDDLTVSLNGKQLVMREGETSQEHDPVSTQGKLRVAWELYRPNFGNTIALQTDLLRFTVFRTDKGSLDKGGLPQPSFLNFHAKLLFPPAHAMEGVVGEGYTRMLRGESNIMPNDGTFYGNPDDYRLPHYFPHEAPASHLLLMPARKFNRKLIEVPEAAVDGYAAAAAELDVSALPDAGAGGFGNEAAWLSA